MVLNKTNFDTICDFFGPETDNWIGKALILVPATVQFNGKYVPTIQVQNHWENDKESTDEIPFNI